MTDPRPVAVVGATGFLGRPVVEALLAGGTSVRAVSRSAARARRVLPVGCQVEEADTSSPEDLRRTLTGCRAVHLNLSPPTTEDAPNPELEVSRRVAEVLSETGVERVSKISALGVQEAAAFGEPLWWAVRDKAEADRAVMACGVPWTLLRPDWFSESLALFVRRGWMLLPPPNPEPLRWIAAADYARQVVAALTTPTAANRAYDLQGPEAVSLPDAARRWAAATPSRVRRLTLPRVLFTPLALLSPDLRYLRDLLHYTYRWTLGFRAADAWEELGRPELTIEDVARGVADDEG